MNGSPSFPLIGFPHFFTFLNAFYPGEVVTARVTLPASGDFFELQSPVGTVVGGPTATPGSLSFTITSFSPTAITARLLSPTFGGSVTFTCIAPGEDGGSEVKFWDPGDDRINREPGQPAALYYWNKGDLHVYAINVDNSKGILGLVVTKAEIDAVISGNPTTNALVKQSADGKFRLFYLPATNELSFITPEVRSGKQYSHVWKGLCP